MGVDRKKLFYRLKFYGIGVGMGLIVVWATLYNGRDERASWLPEGRILEFLEDYEMEVSEQLKCEIECNNLPLNFMDSTFWANAEVDFDKSAVKRKPCPEHYIQSILADGRIVGIYVDNCETCIDCPEELTATLRSVVNITEGNKDCGC
ncbi:MAG: hypothetical protein P1U41_06365 [Vicingaceae bacterium]|nr:hypothetical protein [Vicingaceae bacterium]